MSDYSEMIEQELANLPFLKKTDLVRKNRAFQTSYSRITNRSSNKNSNNCLNWINIKLLLSLLLNMNVCTLYGTTVWNLPVCAIKIHIGFAIKSTEKMSGWPFFPFSLLFFPIQNYRLQFECDGRMRWHLWAHKQWYAGLKNISLKHRSILFFHCSSSKFCMVYV